MHGKIGMLHAACCMLHIANSVLLLRGPALAGLPEGARLRDGLPCWRRPSGAPEAL
eukprot:COSAG01_NODE_8074_length_2931_cov_7.801907_2_plen_56_part_00